MKGKTAMAAMAAMMAATAWGDPSASTTEGVYWWWDPGRAVGTSDLIRTSDGVTAVLHTSELPAGQAVTLWFIMFNHPEACLTNPCSAPDLFNPATGGDFHFASGHVTGGSGNTTFAAHLSVGDVSGSGLVETGLGPAVPLMNPRTAEITLALHSHGPKLKGQDLKRQISSYLGGCNVFNGPDGFAGGPEDVPDAPYECSTIQFSYHPGE